MLKVNSSWSLVISSILLPLHHPGPFFTSTIFLFPSGNAMIHDFLLFFFFFPSFHYQPLSILFPPPPPSFFLSFSPLYSILVSSFSQHPSYFLSFPLFHPILRPFPSRHLPIHYPHSSFHIFTSFSSFYIPFSCHFSLSQHLPIPLPLFPLFFYLILVPFLSLPPRLPIHYLPPSSNTSSSNSASSLPNLSTLNPLTPSPAAPHNYRDPS